MIKSKLFYLIFIPIIGCSTLQNVKEYAIKGINADAENIEIQLTEKASKAKMLATLAMGIL